MAVDLASIDPADFISFRDKWVEECGLEHAADRLFEECGLSELVELNTSELTEYAKEIKLSIIERKRLIKGVRKLNGLSSSHSRSRTSSRPQSARVSRHKPNLSLSAASEPPTTALSTSSQTPNLSTASRRSKKKDRKSDRKKSKSRRRARTSGSRSSRCSSDLRVSTDDLMYDPTAQPTRTPSVSATNKSPSVRLTSPSPDPSAERESSPPSVDIQTRISVALSQIAANAETTKADIRASFLLMRSTLTERELKLLHDVDATLEKKQRLLQTQLEYIRDNDGGGATELVADPDMKLELQRQELLRTLTTTGWVMGATTDNKEELEGQERERKRRELARQQFLTVERLKQITVHERECAAKREDSVRLTNEVHSEIAKINLRAAKVEAELADAKPMMEAAQKLVSSINKRQLDEIRVLKKPPAVVELVCSAVVIVLGNEVGSWRDIQKAMGKSTFIPSMLQFDTMTLKAERRRECVKYTLRSDFTEERANKASKVAGPLVKWVKSQVRYSELLDVVRPMQKEIRVLKKRLEKKQRQLTGVVALVGGLEEKIGQARRDISEMVQNMIKMQDEYDLGEGEEEEKEVAMKIESHNQMYNTPISL